MHISQLQPKGFAVVFMVIVVSAVSLSVSLLLSERALFANTVTKNGEYHQIARYAAEACVERALLEILKDNNYEGIESYTIGETICSVTVIDEGGDERRIGATASYEEATANLLVTTNALSPQLEVTWIDSASF